MSAKNTRWTKVHATAAAKRFAASRNAESWHMFGSAIRGCMVDSFIVGEVRTADSVDSDITFTAADMMEFRRMLIAELAAGVKAHPRSLAVRFAIYED